MEACRGAGHPVLTVELHRAVQFTGLLQGSSGLGYAEPEEDGCARPRSHEVRRVLPGVRREPEEDGCARPRSLLLVLLGRERSERPEDPAAGPESVFVSCLRVPWACARKTCGSEEPGAGFAQLGTSWKNQCPRTPLPSAAAVTCRV